jgi:hypothetical protein
MHSTKKGGFVEIAQICTKNIYIKDFAILLTFKPKRNIIDITVFNNTIYSGSWHTAPRKALRKEK